MSQAGRTKNEQNEPLQTGLDPFISFLIFKFKCINFEKTKFKFIDFEKTYSNSLILQKSNSNSSITRERIQIQNSNSIQP